MKVLHTSDWHLGQQFYEHNRYQEHQCFLDWLCETLFKEDIDLLLIAGDVYHTATPSSSSEQQLYRFIQLAAQRCPNLHIVIIAGNHDSANRIETAKPLLNVFNTHVIGRYEKSNPYEVVLFLDTNAGPVTVIAMPFLRPSDINIDTQEPNSYENGVAQAYLDVSNYALSKHSNGPIITMGHLHSKGGVISDDSERNIAIGGYESLNSAIFTEIPDYVALGHLHKAQKIAKSEHIRYSGSPLPMSFSEINYKHQILIAEFTHSNLTHVKPLYIPRTNQIKVIPKKGGADINTLIEEIDSMDFSSYSNPTYIRLRLNASETDSQFREKIDEALKDKNVLFCGVERVNTIDLTKQHLQFQDIKSVQSLNPIDLLHQTFKEQINPEGTVPEEVSDCLMQVIQSLNDKDQQ